jgi:predicted nucleic acid-binding protein
MPVEKIIVNASPLILLFNSEPDFILPEIFKEIAVPDAVWKEITDSGGSDKASQMIADTRWIKRVSVKPVEDVVRWDLGYGETEVLSFAIVNSEYRPVIDDSAGKKCAVSLGVHTIGTGSLLILAKEKGLIDSVEKSLVKLKNSGMWISESVMKLLKEKAGE